MTTPIPLLLLFLASTPAAGGAPPATAEARADADFQAHDWAAAADAYLQIVSHEPSSALAHFRLGVARLYLAQIDSGLEEIEKAKALGWSPAQVAFRKACGFAASGRIAAATTEIERAAAAGFAQLALLDAEPLLAALRADAGWPKLREQVDRAAHPCRYDARHRAFDFWVGEWDVRPNGAPESTPPAENIVTLEYADCVVHEHWRSPNSSGESFNVYDDSRQQWFQTWVDDSGGLHQYQGAPDRDGNMRFTTDLQYEPNAPRRPTRLTFYRLGADRVRQLSERSEDGGKTWVVNYDLIYLRRTRRPTS